jgi:hypothetical protein
LTTTPSNAEKRFNPPEGLLPHEQVLLVRSKAPGMTGFKGFAVLLLFSAIFLGIGVFGELGPPGSCKINGVTQTGAVCSTSAIYFGFGVGGAMLALTIGGIVTSLVNRNARYFLTSFRIIETRRGKIVREVSRDRFKGKPLTQFLEKGPVFKTPNMSTNMISSVRLLDPESGEVLMTLRGLPEESVDALEAVGSSTYCQYCGQKNDVTRTSCSQCGANL